MTDLKMTTRPGYTAQLNGKILERVKFLAKEINMPDLEAKFPHLAVTDGSWRRAETIADDADLAAYIDHTQLKADADRPSFAKLCDEAKTHHFKTVCVNGCRVKECKTAVADSGVGVACVIGFPLGQMSCASKVAETEEVISQGATEIDMVMNVGFMKDKAYKAVYEEIAAINKACVSNKANLKVIFETCLLTEEEIIDASILSVAADASYIKTSTGFSTGGATPEVIDVMLAVVGNQALVKASGGVRDRPTALQYIQAGVRRIGTSSGIAIVQGGESKAAY